MNTKSATMLPVECITAQGGPFVYIVRAAPVPDATQFVTPEDVPQQVGFVVYPKGATIARHRHRPITRSVQGTTEVLVVRRGRCIMEVFDDNGVSLSSRELNVGDIAIILRGGHAFQMLEDTVLLEVKQGPYTGLNEKEYF
jgi:hypothetical protein